MTAEEKKRFFWNQLNPSNPLLFPQVIGGKKCKDTTGNESSSKKAKKTDGKKISNMLKKNYRRITSEDPEVTEEGELGISLICTMQSLLWKGGRRLQNETSSNRIKILMIDLIIT